MKINQIQTGIFIDDIEIVEIELSNNKGTAVKIINYGAIIKSFVVKNKKNDKQDIVLGFDKIEDYLNDEYLAQRVCLGAVIGRYANRIANGTFELNKVKYQLSKNAGNSTLHGGWQGFDTKIWDVVEIDENKNAVTLQYESEDGEENFPGNLLVELTFELTDNDELILSFEGDTDQDTPINLTHHSYFNLSPSLNKVDKHQLQIFASNYLEQDDNYTVTGKLIEVKNTPFDFTTTKEIGKDWNPEQGYDQTFVLDKNYGDLTLASKTFEPESGLTLSVYSTEPVAHLYTAKYLNVPNGKNGVPYTEFGGFCIETHHHPNAVNINSFPNTILKPDELYTQTTIYKVSIEE
jgi:aldose 1-epimerase